MFFSAFCRARSARRPRDGKGGGAAADPGAASAAGPSEQRALTQPGRQRRQAPKETEHFRIKEHV